MVLALILPLYAAGSVGKASHPYLYFTEKDLQRLKEEAFETPQYLDESSFKVRYFGDMIVTYLLPPVQPPVRPSPPGFSGSNYPYWTAMSREIQSRLQNMALSYVTTGNEEYSRRAISYALSMVGWKTWTKEYPGYDNPLSLSHISMGVAALYDILYDKMSPEERATVRDGLARNGLASLVEMCRNATRDSTNGAVLLHSALGMTSLALLGEVKMAESTLATAVDYVRWWLDYQAKAGKTEGILYTGYAVNNLFPFLLAHYNATGDESLIKHPYIEDYLVKWLIYFSSSDFKGAANFSDAHVYSVDDYVMPFTILANKFGNGYAGWYLMKRGQNGVAMDDFYRVVYDAKEIKDIQSPEGWPTGALFNVGWAALRTGWGDDDVLLAFKSSQSDLGHEHMDQNHFVLNANGEWLFTDPGYKTYTTSGSLLFTQGTEGHNALMVDGQGQPIRGGGRIETFFDSPAITYVVGDASKGYSGRVSWKRHILQVKRGAYYLFLDEVRSVGSSFFGGGGTHELTFLLHPMKGSAAIEIDGERIYGQADQMGSEMKVVVKKASALWRVIYPDKVKIVHTIHPDALWHILQVWTC